MANPNTSEKSNYLDREENITKGNISAKSVSNYTYDAIKDALVPGSSPFTLDADNSIATVKLEPDGVIPVRLKDVTDETLDLYFIKTINNVTLAANAIVDTYTLTLVAGHSCAPGDILTFKEGTRFMRVIILTVVTNTITIDTPIEYAFTTAASVARGSYDMNVDGSTTTQIFEVSPSGMPIVDHITGITLVLESNTATDDSKFGNLTALTKGIVLRVKDGTYKTIFNLKTNGAFRHYGQLEYTDKSGGGNYGVALRQSFIENNAVVVKLDGLTDESLQIIVQDNLTGLTKFRAKAHGHVVIN